MENREGGKEGLASQARASTTAEGRGRGWFAASALMAAGIFVLDLLTPLPTVVWALYILPLLLVNRVPGRFPSFVLTAGCTVAVLAGVHLAPGVDRQWEFLNRSMAVGILWVTEAILLQRRRAWDEVRREHFLRATVENSVPTGLLAIDREGRILHVNDTLCRMTGWSREELLGLALPYPFWPPERVQEYRDAMRREILRDDIPPKDAEVEFRRRDGKRFHVAITTAPLPDGGITRRGFVSSFVDITERKRAEEELHRQLHFLQALLDALPNPVFFKDARGIYLGCNVAFEEYLGKPRSEIIGKGVHDVSPKELADIYWKADQELFRTGGVQVYEASLVYADGTRHEVMFHKALFREPGGDVGGIIGSVLDITRRKRTEEELERHRRHLEELVAERTADLTEACTSLKEEIAERRRAEERLRESEKEYRRIVETAREGIWITDAGYRTTFVNPVAAEMLGCTVPEMMGRSAYDFLFEEDRETADRIQEMWKTGGGKRYDFRYRRKDGGEVWAIVSTSPLTDEAGHYAGVLRMMTDITERRQLEERLHDAQRLESVGVLAGGIAHQFNNLMTVVNGYAERILSRPDADIPYRHDVEQIRKSGERAAALTRQLLAFSRRQLMLPKVTDLNETITGMEKALRGTVGDGIRVELRCSPSLWSVNVDPAHVGHALSDLAANARDAMSGSGKLVIETGNVVLDEAFVRRHPDVAPGEYVLLAVSDTGRGMDEITRKRLFEPFFTTKAVGHGTGLGLSTVYGIVKQSGGYIEVESEPGRGTTFRIFLPRAEPEEPAGWSSGAPPQDMERKAG